MGVNQYLNVALCNIYQNKQIQFNCNTLIWFTLFLWGYANCMGVLGLSLGVRVLHEAKNNQILYNTLMGVLGLKIGLMKYVLSYPKSIP